MAPGWLAGAPWAGWLAGVPWAGGRPRGCAAGGVVGSSGRRLRQRLQRRRSEGSRPPCQAGPRPQEVGRTLQSQPAGAEGGRTVGARLGGRRAAVVGTDSRAEPRAAAQKRLPLNASLRPPPPPPSSKTPVQACTGPADTPCACSRAAPANPGLPAQSGPIISAQSSDKAQESAARSSHRAASDAREQKRQGR